MPALTPEQRKRQIALAKASKKSNKPKPGQKGAPTGPGSGQVRYSKPSPKPPAKPAATKVGNIPTNEGTGKGSPNDKPKASKPKPTSAPAAKPAPASAPRAAAPSKPAAPMPKSSPKPASNVGPVADGENYARSKDPKKYNPLMQKTFGYQTGDAPDQRKAKDLAEKSSKAEYKVSDEEGKRRLAEGLRKMQEEREKQKKGTSAVVSS